MHNARIIFDLTRGMTKGISLLKLLNRKVPSATTKKVICNCCCTFPLFSILIFVHKQCGGTGFLFLEFVIFLLKNSFVFTSCNELV